jgi:hypothetical protein
MYPEQCYAYHRCARALVGCAVGHAVVGTAEDVRQAKRAVARAIQLFRASGMSREQAAEQVVAYAQSLEALE